MWWSAWTADESTHELPLAAAAAKGMAAVVLENVTETLVQVHGGIGFTWEHPLHRYYKRALWLEGALGYGREHRAEVASYLLSS